MTREKRETMTAEKATRKPKMYLMRVRYPSEEWIVNEDEVFTKREAEKHRQFIHVMGGVRSQLWPYEEWMTKHSKSAASSEVIPADQP